MTKTYIKTPRLTRYIFLCGIDEDSVLHQKQRKVKYGIGEGISITRYIFPCGIDATIDFEEGMDNISRLTIEKWKSLPTIIYKKHQKKKKNCKVLTN